MEAALERDYLLRNDAHELRRLERQGAMLRAPSLLLLRQAGIDRGMRVLDLGTAIGELAFLAAEVVGPEGEVVGVDQSADALAVAQQRARTRGLRNVSFTQGDIASWSPPGQFDAVIGRLVLIYLEDPAAVIRRHALALRPGGLYLALEYDLEVTRTIPPTPLASRALGWMKRAFSVGRVDLSLGPRLGTILTRAGLPSPTVVGLQAFLPPNDPGGPAALAGIVQSLLPVIDQAEIAAREEVGIATLEHRLAAEMVEHGVVVAPPTLVGAWARRES